MTTTSGGASALAKTYDPAAVESRRYAEWLAAGVFHEEPDPARPPFIISMPPPNITGRAHLGHASSYTVMDVLTRYHRMLGENADWLPGQDHAAIATEAVVVRELAREGLTRDDLGREKFVERVWQWRETYGDAIYEAFRALGFGPDWDRDRFTMDATLTNAVYDAFIALYRDGLIYRGTRLVNWDAKSRSTLSDAEVEDEERDGFLWQLRYPAADGSFAIEVATTRPETMLGDTAIAVHPSDERYAPYVGKRVLVPLVGREIPIVADDAVDREFGTGAVKVTPAHDRLDNEIGERHGLPMPMVIGYDGTMTDEAPPAYRGLDRLVARDAIVRDLAASGALVSTTPRRHAVPISSRSGEIVEPLLSLQWFCKMESLAGPALAAYREGRVRFVPERFGRTFEHWLENIRDWNVSRQIWWGHQLPVWYAPNDEPIVARSEEEARASARERFGEDVELRRDPDTLDTWFSSGLWPFSILGWPQKSPELADWYPNTTLVTGREIIFLWVSRMVMLGLHFAKDVPFRDVFIAPLVFDDQGRKMSKSLGNVIEPLDLIAEYGADATRLGILRQMRLESQELRFDERYVQKAREFNNKLWQALRYTIGLPEGIPRAGRLPAAADLTIADRWILAELRATIVRVSDAYDAYEFGVAGDALVDFAWYRLCDWYLESTKAPVAARTRAAVLSYVLNALARLLHPIAPFVTEEIWQTLPHDGKTIVTAMWPDVDELVADEGAHARYEAVRDAVARLRDVRRELGLSERERLVVDASTSLDEQSAEFLAQHAFVAVERTLPAIASGDDALASVAPRVPFERLRERYAKEELRLRGEVERLRKKLGNEAYVAKAPEAAVSNDREKLAGYEAELARASAALATAGAGSEGA